MPAPTASFTGTPTSGEAPLEVTFTDTSTGDPTAWTWEMNDSSDLSWQTFSTDQNPVAIFDAGSWNIRLTAANNSGSDVATESNYIVVGSLLASAPLIYLEDPENVFDYVNDWKECMDNTQPGGGNLSSRESQEDVLVGFIPFEKVRSARQYFLGYSYADMDSPYALHRELPARHPIDPQLYAYTFTSTGLSVLANFNNPDNSPYELSPWPNTNGDDIWYGTYDTAICTIRYKSFNRMLFLADDDASLDGTYTTEWKRYTMFSGAPGIQALTADGTSQLIFAEGPEPGPDKANPAGPFGTPFPAPVALLMAKVKFSVDWFDVPHEYLSTSQYFLNPVKIIQRLGTTNSAEMFDGEFAVGTMLLVAAEFEPILFPVVPIDLNNPITGWHVKLHWEQFDPENRYSDDFRGHLIYPWRVDSTWYYATTQNGDTLLPQTDHMKVFQHVLDPT